MVSGKDRSRMKREGSGMGGEWGVRWGERGEGRGRGGGEGGGGGGGGVGWEEGGEGGKAPRKCSLASGLHISMVHCITEMLIPTNEDCVPSLFSPPPVNEVMRLNLVQVFVWKEWSSKQDLRNCVTCGCMYTLVFYFC